MELCSHNKKDGVIVGEGFKHEQWRWGAEDGANRQLACHSCLKGWRERGTLRKGHKGAWWRCGSAVSCSPAHMFSATRAHVKANVHTRPCSWKPRKTSGSYKATARLRGQTGRKPPNSSSTRARTGRQMHFHCSLCLSAVPSWDSLRPLFSHPFLIALLLFVLILCTFVVVSAFSFPSCAHLACRITSKVLLFPSFGLFLFVMVVLSPRPSFHIRAWPAALLLTPVGGILTFLCGSSSFFVVWEFPCASFGFSFFFPLSSPHMRYYSSFVSQEVDQRWAHSKTSFCSQCGRLRSDSVENEESKWSFQPGIPHLRKRFSFSQQNVAWKPVPDLQQPSRIACDEHPCISTVLHQPWTCWCVLGWTFFSSLLLGRRKLVQVQWLHASVMRWAVLRLHLIVLKCLEEAGSNGLQPCKNGNDIRGRGRAPPAVHQLRALCSDSTGSFPPWIWCIFNGLTCLS